MTSLLALLLVDWSENPRVGNLPPSTTSVFLVADRTGRIRARRSTLRLFPNDRRIYKVVQAFVKTEDLSMKFGVCIPNFGETSSVDGLRTVAIEAEKMGYDSIWTTDLILMPTQSGTPYERIFESVTSLAYLAALTSTAKLGVSSLVMAMRNPVVLAKQLATIDHFSAGRVMLATGAGWNEKEFVHLGSNFKDRGTRLDESIRLVRELWVGGADVKFEGRKIPHKFNKVMFEPSPIQKKLTIWISGASKAAMRRAATIGDAWHPNVYPLEVFRKLVSEFRGIPGGEDKAVSVRIGLNPKATKTEYTGPQGERRLMLAGNMPENRKIISELEKLGVSYVLVNPTPDGRVPIYNQVASLRMLAEEFVRKSDYIR
jgi:probable F420-dependent oxidoreductase